MDIKTSFKSLTPVDDIDLDIYEDAFNFVFDKDDVLNVAISGPYSSGKSSLLESYKKKHSEKKYLHISLAHFESPSAKDAAANCGSPSAKGEENEKSQAKLEVTLEGKILNQLAQQIDPDCIPQTNFHIKHDINTKAIAKGVAGLVAVVLTLLHIVMFDSICNWLSLISGSWLGYLLSFLSSPYSKLVSFLICVMVFSYGAYHLTQIQADKNILRKITIEGNEIELFGDSDNSYFDKYLNEVLYLFENSGVDVIVFEDIDRFNSTLIFERLREINHLVNLRLQKKGKTCLRFFYLLRDDTFVNKDRTKFFDFIIPVIPAIDGSNSYNKIKELLSSFCNLDIFDRHFLERVSLYINDYRVLKNICNEFSIYYGKLQGIELDPNVMFALITYKNLFPRDYSGLQLNHVENSFVAMLFDNRTKEAIVLDEQRRLQAQIDRIQSRISAMDTEVLNSKAELDTVYKGRLSGASGPRKEKIQQEKDARMQSIKDRQEHSKKTFEDEISTLEIAKRELSERKLREIITRENADVIFGWGFKNEIGTEYKYEDVKSSEYFALLRYLISNGYINETYADYMSYFYEGDLSVTDKLYLRSVTDRRAKPYDYKIEDVSLVLEKMVPMDFTQEETRNFYIFHEILQNPVYEEFLTRFIEQLKEYFPFDFLYQYLESGMDTDIFIIKLCQKWNGFFGVMLPHKCVTETQANAFCHALLQYCDSDLCRAVNVDNVVTYYISQRQDFLDSPPNNSSHYSENLMALEIQFVKVDEKNSSKAMLEIVYQCNAYELNYDNISLFAKQHFEGFSTIENFFTTMFYNQDEALYSYAYDNMDAVVQMVTENVSTIKDTETSALAILNFGEVSTNNKLLYLAKIEVIFESLDLIALADIRKEVIRLSKAKHTVNNIMLAYKDSGLSSELVSFMNGSSPQISFDLVDQASLTSLAAAVVKCSALSDTMYEKILVQSQYKCEKFSILGLSQKKMNILIERHILVMNNTNLSFIARNYKGSVSNFICANPDGFVRIPKQNRANISIDQALQMDLPDDSLRQLINELPSNIKISIKRKKIKDSVCQYILQKRFDSGDTQWLMESFSSMGPLTMDAICEKMRGSLSQVIAQSDKADLNLISALLAEKSISRQNKCNLLVAYMSRLNKQQCREFLELAGFEELAKALDRRRHPQIKVDSINQKILDAMQKHEFIKGYHQNNDVSMFVIN